MTDIPLMPKATAVWLVDNTSLSFDQIAEFCRLHPLEVKAIADGEAAVTIKGLDPVLTGQLTREEIQAAEADKKHKLRLANPKVRVPTTITKRKGPRYTPVSRRQDRPNAILWLLRNHPELKDAQIMRLVGTTKPTIESIRSRQHWNANNLSPLDPVTLGLVADRSRFRGREGGEGRRRRPRLAGPRPDLPRRGDDRRRCAGCRGADSHAVPKQQEQIDADAVFASWSSMKAPAEEPAETPGGE
jgi:hypothetical protein